MKRLLSFLLCLAMLLSMFPVQAMAMESLEPASAPEAEGELLLLEETIPSQPAAPETQPSEAQEYGEETELYEPQLPLVNGEELTLEDRYNGYVESLFYEKPVTPFSTGSESAGAKLTGDEKKAYDALVPIIKEIAAGNRASTMITLSPSGGDAVLTFQETFEEFEWRKVLRALWYDLAYEMYWFRNSTGLSYGYGSGGVLKRVTYKFSVDAKFRLNSTDEYTVDTAKTSVARTAAKNAKAIVKKYEAKSEYEKLLGYKEEICALNTYNDAAAEDDSYSSRDYGPWQLVYVFDKNTSTNVVCGGYAKAFQYLCDLSGIPCYYILGYTSGYHAWNIVTFENKNYLVDVTNSEPGTWGQDGSLFLAGGSGSVESGYTITNSRGSKLKYTYERSNSHDMVATWGTRVLTLASASYRPCSHSYTSKVTKQPTEYETGIRTYTCSGCGHSYTETVAKLPHTTHRYTAKVTDPTCTEQGYTTYTCPCGYSYKDHYVAAKGHTSVADPAVEATCQKTGLSEGAHCSVCGVVLTEQKVTPIVDHKFVEHRCKWCGLIGGQCGTNVIWRLDEANGILSITGTGAMEERFGDQPWLGFQDKIKTAQVGTGVTKVTYGAFAKLTRLTRVTLPESVTELGDCVFDGCISLSSVNIPGKVTRLGNLIFQNCTSLTEFEIPDQITVIGGNAFEGCTGLSELVLPDGLVELGSGAFSGCTGLTRMTIPEGITVLEDWMFYGCMALESVTLPERLGSIGDGAFGQCKAMASVSLPEGLFTIGDSAFSGCESLTELVIPASVVSIGSMALSAGNKLAVVRFQGDAPQIDRLAFSGVTLIAYYPQNNATWTAEKRAQYGGILTWVEETGETAEYSGFCGDRLVWQYNSDTGVLTISGTGDMYDFSEDTDPDFANYVPNYPWRAVAPQIQKVVVKDGCTSLGENAFYNCISLTQVELPQSVQKIGRAAFYSCARLSSIELPAGITQIDTRTFAFCTELRSIEIPEGVTEIGASAFGFTGLEEITIPGSVVKLGTWAFERCYDLQTVTFLRDAPVFEDRVFYDTVTTAYYPESNATWTADVRQDHGGTVTWIGRPCNHQAEAVSGKAPTCTEPGRTSGTACKYCGAVISGCRYLAPLGHSFGSYTHDTGAGTHSRTCRVCRKAETQNCTFGEAELYRLPTAASQGMARYTCMECGGSYQDVFRGTLRIAGDDRMETAFEAADMLKQTLGVEKFQTILIASGSNFADALAGSYLAAVKGAPILLSRGGHRDNLNYILDNLAYDGIVYILGGTAAVPQELEDLLVDHGIFCQRLAGSNRLDTNLKILETAGIQGSEILVATGWNFADSLSASATGKPILMVNNTAKTLTSAQKNYLRSLGYVKFTIIGGYGAVAAEFEKELEEFGIVERLAGGTRELTSVLVARRYFDKPHTAMLAYSRNFPDGLCGGPLAYAAGAPLLLVNKGTELGAAAYVMANGIEAGYIMGGTAAVSEHSAAVVFGS